MKKILSAVLGVVMIVVMAVPATATRSIWNTPTTLTIPHQRVKLRII